MGDAAAIEYGRQMAFGEYQPSGDFIVVFVKCAASGDNARSHDEWVRIDSLGWRILP